MKVFSPGAGVRGLDTAYNYRSGTSHQLLRRVAGDLLPELAVSTKVGFFPRRGGAEHSLDPTRLRHAVQESVTTLGITPGVVFLHNPEQSLAGLPARQAARRLVAACAVLRDATAAGWCRSWGISCWSSTALLTVLDHLPGGDPLAPEALMVRAGLSVTAPALQAGEHLAARLGLRRDAVWGMSPFGGDPRHPAWTTATTATFLAPGQHCTPLQAAFRVAFEVPPVGRVAVGASTGAQLRALVAATTLDIDSGQVARYRNLVRDRALTR